MGKWFFSIFSRMTNFFINSANVQKFKKQGERALFKFNTSLSGGIGSYLKLGVQYTTWGSNIRQIKPPFSLLFAPNLDLQLLTFADRVSAPL